MSRGRRGGSLAVMAAACLLAWSTLAAPTRAHAAGPGAAFYLQLLTRLPLPQEDWFLSDHVLVKAMRTITDREGQAAFDARRAQAPAELRGRDGVLVPRAALAVFREATRRALGERLGIPDDGADELASRLQRCAMAAAGVSPASHPTVSDARLRGALRAVLSATERSRSYDVPYVAGYAERDGRRIYIDRDLPPSFRTPDGRTIEVIPFLGLHEATEKAFIDGLALPYQSAHQLALRLEREAVLAHGFTWEAYDAFFVEQIARIDAKRPTRLPPDLDLTPYRDEADERLPAMLAQMAATRATAPHR